MKHVVFEFEPTRTQSVQNGKNCTGFEHSVQNEKCTVGFEPTRTARGVRVRTYANTVYEKVARGSNTVSKIKNAQCGVRTHADRVSRAS
jgi:hypothetical protein